MKHSLIVIALLLSLGISLVAQERGTVEVNKKKHTFYYFTPKEATGYVPLIVLLNTSGRHGDEMVSAWTTLAGKENFALVSFDPDDSRGWNQKVDSDTLAAVLDQFTSTNPIDRRRVYLFGVGIGGNYGLTLVAAGGGQFFAAAATYGSAMIGNLAMVNKNGPAIPLSISVGMRDRSVLPQAAEKTAAAFKSAGYTVLYTELPGEDNSYQLKADRVNTAAWEFLKDKSH